MYWLPSLPPSQSRPLVSWITCAEGEAKACEKAAVTGSINLLQLGQAKPQQPGRPTVYCPCDPGDCPGVASGIQQKLLDASRWERLPAKAALASHSPVAVLGSRKAPPPAAVSGKGPHLPLPSANSCWAPTPDTPPATAAGLGGLHVASSTLKVAGSCRKNLSYDMKMKWCICIKACSEEGSQSTQGQG